MKEEVQSDSDSPESILQENEGEDLENEGEEYNKFDSLEESEENEGEDSEEKEETQNKESIEKESSKMEVEQSKKEEEVEELEEIVELTQQDYERLLSLGLFFLKNVFTMIEDESENLKDKKIFSD